MLVVKKIVIGDTELSFVINEKSYNSYKNMKKLVKKVFKKFINMVKRND